MVSVWVVQCTARCSSPESYSFFSEIFPCQLLPLLRQAFRNIVYRQNYCRPTKDFVGSAPAILLSVIPSRSYKAIPMRPWSFKARNLPIKVQPVIAHRDSRANGSEVQLFCPIRVLKEIDDCFYLFHSLSKIGLLGFLLAANPSVMCSQPIFLNK
jgi:hypothetical protein